jgi:hypothetical protein
MGLPLLPLGKSPHILRGGLGLRMSNGAPLPFHTTTTHLKFEVEQL